MHFVSKKYLPVLLSTIFFIGCESASTPSGGTELPIKEVPGQPSPTPVPTVSVRPTPKPTPSPSTTPTPTPTPTATVSPSPSNPINLKAAWANDGGDKVARQEIRATRSPASVTNSVWNGSQIKLFGAKNEVVGFNFVLEAGTTSPRAVKVSFDKLVGSSMTIGSTPTDKAGVFNWTKRDIELFYVRYLKIKGLSKFASETYDERHIPSRLRRPFTGAGYGTGTWTDRPDHDKDYPDIAVPLEAVGTFTIPANTSQSIWADVYIPKNAPAGVYKGTVSVTEDGHASYNIPVSLTVRGFTLPDVPSSKTMLYFGYADIEKRYGGSKLRQVRDRHFQMAHRHKISLIDHNEGTLSGPDQPSDEWIPRLDGRLFSAAQGYRGPGEGVGNGLFSVGTYGSASWQNDGSAAVSSHSGAWADWFRRNFPAVETFLYLIDESSDYPQIQKWATDLLSNSSDRRLASMATLSLPQAMANTPALTVVTSTMDVGDTQTWNSALAKLRSDPSKRFYMYNGKRPASGSFMIDDDGTALREVPWGQYKKGVNRWFYWESTYYTDFQSGRGNTDVFSNAQTFGATPTMNSVLGMTSGNYANGDGVLFYPGTDQIFPSQSYGLDGPIASLRLKHWRRGIQDVDYLKLAAAKDPTRTQAVVNRMVKSVLWENGIADPSDPSWVRCDIGWPTQADAWEAARLELANIIEGT